MNSRGAQRFSTELKNLYSDDFGDAELSSKQVQAINDPIKAENKVEEILKWICGRNYNVVVCDKHGIEILADEGESQKWEATLDTVLGVVVIDNYNSRVVCTKTFQYINDLFILA